MFESLLFFFAAVIALEFAAINRNGRKEIKQRDEIIHLLGEFLNQKNN